MFFPYFNTSGIPCQGALFFLKIVLGDTYEQPPERLGIEGEEGIKIAAPRDGAVEDEQKNEYDHGEDKAVYTEGGAQKKG